MEDDFDFEKFLKLEEQHPKAKEKSFKCSNCAQSFATLQNLERHISNNSCYHQSGRPRKTIMSTKRELDLSREDSGQDNHVTHIIKVQLEKKAKYVSLLLSLSLTQLE